MRRYWMLLAISTLFFGLIMAGQERSDEQAAHETYCEMIDIHKASSGKYGWPDDGRECK